MNTRLGHAVRVWLPIAAVLFAACAADPIDRPTADRRARERFEQYVRDTGHRIDLFTDVRVSEHSDAWLYLYEYRGVPRHELAIMVSRTGGVEIARTFGQPDRLHAPGEGIKIEDIEDVSTSNSTLHVTYRTGSSIRDVQAHATELPQVWDLVVRARLKESAAQNVDLIPEAPTGRSLGVTFTRMRQASGRRRRHVPSRFPSVEATNIANLTLNALLHTRFYYT